MAKYYEVSIENYHDNLSKAEGKAYYGFDNPVDAQIKFSQKMASGINDANTKKLINLVIPQSGHIDSDYKDNVEKYSAEDTRVFRHYLFVLFTYDNGSEDEVVLSGYDDFNIALSNYYSKRGAGMGKANIDTVTEVIFNSYTDEERSYSWNKNGEPTPEPNE